MKHFPRALRQEINRRAHSEAQQEYERVRAALLDQAAALLADGRPADEILKSLCARDVRAREAETDEKHKKEYQNE